MKRILFALLLLLKGCDGSLMPIYAQTPGSGSAPPQTIPGKVYTATQFGQWLLYVNQGNSTTGTANIFVNGYNSQGPNIPTFTVGLPFLIDKGNANAETVTVASVQICNSGVNNCVTSQICNPGSQLCLISATFGHTHSSFAIVQSAWDGLQEAVNYAQLQQGGTVLIDPTWTGTTSNITSGAKGSIAVAIQDNRSGTPVNYQWQSTAYVAVGSGGSSGVPNVNGITTAVTITGDSSISVTPNSPSAGSIQLHATTTGGIQSINGDTTAAQQIAGTGGITCATIGGTTTCNYAGGAGTGAVATAAANQAGCYLAAGTTISGCTQVFFVDPGMSQANINTLTAAMPAGSSLFIPAGAPQIGYTNTGSQVPHDFRLGADYFQMPGAACDGRQSALGITITSGSNTSNVGALFSAADVGKTFFFYLRSGYSYGSTQSVWTATLTAYSNPTATWSANAPFSASGQVFYGTDNLPAVTAGMAQASNLFPLTIPTGCYLLVNGTIQWNSNQTIISRHQNQGGFIGVPAQDVISTVDSSGNSVSTAGTGLKGFAIFNGTEIDATLGYNLYSANGALTVVPPLYRPAYDHSSIAPNPLAPGWITGGVNGVSTIAQNSAVICTSNSYASPVVGRHIIFPYFASIFSAVVSSTAGSCPSGFTARTLSVAFPNTSTYNAAQAEWFAGTAIQSTTTAIPTTISYPLTLALTLPINPAAGWISNFPQHGTVKVCGIEAEYMGFSGQGIVLRRGPASSAGCTGTTPIAVVNMCRAKNMLGPGGVDQPWPVIPSINSGDSTPSGANWFPGECVGNAAIAFPTADGNTYVGAGLVGGFLEDLDLIGTAGAGSGNANNAAGIYIAGNNAPFASHVENLVASNLQYDLTYGPASSGQHGVAAVGPTGIGNTFRNFWFFGAFPISLVDTQSTTIDDLNMNSAEISPFDGTAVGSSTCLQEGFTLDEQNGNFVTTTQFLSHRSYACEPEGGTHIEVNTSADIQGTHISFDTANFEGVPNVFGGDHLKLTNSIMSFPTMDYGAQNDYGTLDGNAMPYLTQIYDGSAQMLFWGQGARCSITSNLGAPIACGASTVQGYEGRSADPSFNGSAPFFAMGGVVTPWMWNSNGSLDSAPMTTTGTTDTTAAYWGASATCAISPSAQCHVKSFHGFNGYTYIGPWNQISPIKYTLDASYKTLSGSSQFVVIISAEDPGSGTCVSGSYTQLLFQTVNTTTSFSSPLSPVVDFSGSTGCVLGVQFFEGTTTDTLVVDKFSFVPAPNYVRGPVSAPTEGGSCPAGSPSSAWLGSFSGFSYFCDGGTVKRVGIS